MLHRVPFIFSPVATALVCMAAVAALGFGEMLADRIPQPLTPMDEFDVVALRDFAMPNYWMWYHGEDIPQVLRALGRVDLHPLIMITLYQACVGSWVVGTAMIWLAMFFAVRTLSFNSRLNWIWVVGLLALVADLAEDLLLLVTLINFPVAVYPNLNEWTSWCSFFKFVLWGAMLGFDALAGALWLCGRRISGAPKLKG